MTGSSEQASVSRRDDSLPSRLSRHTGTLALVAFSLSGCAGLIYQSVWAQYLGLFLGHAAYAQSLVLAIFMGGMAGGAWWAGTRTTHRRNLLRAYAWVELGIGVRADLPPDLCHRDVVRLLHFRPSPAMARQRYSRVLAAALIFPQSALLGDLPLMSNALMLACPAAMERSSAVCTSHKQHARSRCVVCDVLLLPAAGPPGARWCPLPCSMDCCGGGICIGRHAGNEPSRKCRRSGSACAPRCCWRVQRSSQALPRSPMKLVGWMLSLAFGSTLHAFELMPPRSSADSRWVACGIRSRIDRYAQPLRGADMQADGHPALASLMLYNQSFDWVAWCMRIIPKTDDGYALFNVATAAGAILIMAPTAFFAGMTLPLFTLELIRRGGGEASVGRVYAANTVGAIVGVLVAVHALLPVYGLKQTMIVAAVGDLALGLFLLWRTRAQRQVLAYAGIVLLCSLAVATTMSLAKFDPMAMAAGVYRGGAARPTAPSRGWFSSRWQDRQYL